jgi:hypothetical protein
MKMNRWHKIGIVLSILWALIAGIQTRDDDVKRANDFGQYAYKVCAETQVLMSE